MTTVELIACRVFYDAKMRFQLIFLRCFGDDFITNECKKKWGVVASETYLQGFEP